MHSSKVSVWSCFSSQDFARIASFKHNFNAEFMFNIYKCSTARKQFGLDSTIYELQEDNHLMHTWKIALNRKASHRIQKIDWPPTSSALASIENIW